MKCHTKSYFVCVATRHNRAAIIAIGCGFDSHSAEWNILCLHFLFLAVVIRTKRSVESRHLTRNGSRIRRKLGNESVSMWTLCHTRFPGSPSVYGWDTAWSYKKLIYIVVFYTTIFKDNLGKIIKHRRIYIININMNL